MKAVVLAYDNDYRVGPDAPKRVYSALMSLPAEDRDFITMISDDHGEPPIFATHETVYQEVDAADWHGIWKLSSGLFACVFTGQFCEYALGDTPEQRNMGEWSDGVPVAELVVVDDPNEVEATPEASPVALDPAMVAGTYIQSGNPARTGEFDDPGPAGQPVVLWDQNIADLSNLEPAVGDGVVFVAAQSKMVALDKETGEEIWSVPHLGTGSAPLLNDGIIYIGTGGEGLKALDALTGEILWSFLPEPDAPAGDNPPHNIVDGSPLIADGVLYTNGGPWGGVYALDPATGQELWRFDTEAGSAALVSVADGILYQVTDALFDGRRQNGEPPAPSGLVALDPTTGAQLWKYELPDGSTSFTTPAVHNGIVLIGESVPDLDRGIYHALDATTGAEIWTLQMPSAVWGSRPTAAGDLFLIPGAFSSGLYGVDAATGTIVWEHETDGSLLLGTLVANGVAYLHSDDGVVAALDPATGQQLWSLETNDVRTLNVPAVIAVDGDVIYAVAGNRVYAIGGDGSAVAPDPASAGYPVQPAVAAGAETYATFTGTLAPPDPFGILEGIDIGPDGTLYMIDSENDQVKVFDPDGNFVEAWGGTGSGEGEFKFHDPNQGFFLGDIAVGADGVIYVLDPGNKRVQVFDATRQFVRQWGASITDPGFLQFPSGIGMDDLNGRVFVADLDPGQVKVYDLDGVFIEHWGIDGPNTSTFRDPTDIAVGADGTVYIAERGRSKVRVFSSEGEPLAVRGGLGEEPGRLTSNWGLDIDGDGNLYVADYHGDRVEIFAPDGSVLGVPGHAGDGEGELRSPAWVAVAPDGTLYVSEEGAMEVSIFVPGGAAPPVASPEA